MRDSQRTAVYRWEDFIRRKFPSCNDSLSFHECELLVKQVWKDYFGGLARCPEVRRGRDKGRTASGGLFRITLPPWAMCKLVVLHEVAHSIAMHSGHYEPHGPDFCRLMLQLWEDYADTPTKLLMNLAEKPRHKTYRGRYGRRVQIAEELKIIPMSLAAKRRSKDDEND